MLMTHAGAAQCGHRDLVTVDPYVGVLQLTPDDEFILLGCDGLFDFNTSVDRIAGVVRGGLQCWIGRRVLRFASHLDAVSAACCVADTDPERASFWLFVYLSAGCGVRVTCQQCGWDCRVFDGAGRAGSGEGGRGVERRRDCGRHCARGGVVQVCTDTRV